jgi:hypothetical protein
MDKCADLRNTLANQILVILESNVKLPMDHLLVDLVLMEWMEMDSNAKVPYLPLLIFYFKTLPNLPDFLF